MMHLFVAVCSIVGLSLVSADVTPPIKDCGTVDTDRTHFGIIT